MSELVCVLESHTDGRENGGGENVWPGWPYLVLFFSGLSRDIIGQNPVTMMYVRLLLRDGMLLG